MRLLDVSLSLHRIAAPLTLLQTGVDAASAVPLRFAFANGLTTAARACVESHFHAYEL